MAYRSSHSSDSGSPSPSENDTSKHVSSSVSRRASQAMGRTPESEPSSRSTSARGTPNRVSVDLPRTQSASKGGCWTCRLRRKKCDEQREGDSCRTCIRLKIECLGWGPKRPDWMRDKQAVEAYKANIKAQLTRAGLIRGQPRASMLQAQQAAAATATKPPTQARPSYHRFSAPADTSSPSGSTSLGLEPDNMSYHRFGPSILPGVAGASSPSFLQLPAASYSEPNVSTFDVGAPFFQYSPPQSTTPLSSGGSSEPLDFDFSQFDLIQNNGGYEYDLRPPSPIPSFSSVSGQTSMHEQHVVYYFENVTKLHFLFGGNAVTNITYQLIVQDPRGAVTNAVCALASLHSSRMRVALGLEAPDPNPEHSTAKYFHDEAYYQLVTARQLRGCHNESDVLAALHLICFSQMSGGTTDWQALLAIALDWLGQTGLPSKDNPRLILNNMTPAAQLVVKCTMWMDIFSTLTSMRPPKYLSLYQKLLGPQNVFWQNETEFSSGLGMETLTGCPDEAMLGIAEVSVLAHWKAAEKRKGSLSLRELVRRGDEIEQRLHQRASDPMKFREQAPLHPNLLQTGGDSADVFPTAETLRTLASIFRETVVLYLHTVLNDANPAVSEISSSVGNIVQLLQQLQPSEIDRAVTFPICLAGCMTDDSIRREFLKSRLQSQDENIGNLMRIRLLMESVWQKRDVSGRAIDWRETIGERGLNLLLV